MKLQSLFENERLTQDEMDAIADIIDGTLDSVKDWADDDDPDDIETTVRLWTGILRKLNHHSNADDWEEAFELGDKK